IAAIPQRIAVACELERLADGDVLAATQRRGRLIEHRQLHLCGELWLRQQSPRSLAPDRPVLLDILGAALTVDLGRDVVGPASEPVTGLRSRDERPTGRTAG